MLIVGLGNPGEKYVGTRHNAGQDIVRYCADKLCESGWVEDKYIGGDYKDCQEHIFFLPATFMNNSGEAVYRAMEAFSFTAPEMIVVHDELDLDFGEVKISFNKDSAGHKGVQSIIDKVGKDFIRIRVGITNQYTDKKDKSDFVLEKFNSQEQEKMQLLKERVCEAIKELLENGLQKAMTKINSYEKIQ